MKNRYENLFCFFGHFWLVLESIELLDLFFSQGLQRPFKAFFHFYHENALFSDFLLHKSNPDNKRTHSKIKELSHISFSFYFCLVSTKTTVKLYLFCTSYLNMC